MRDCLKSDDLYMRVCGEPDAWEGAAEGISARRRHNEAKSRVEGADVRGAVEHRRDGICG